MDWITIRRYTKLEHALEILRTRQLTLRPPWDWDDKNDVHFMREFARRTSAKSLLTLCFARSEETYHHWAVYAKNEDDVCIEFDETSLQAATKECGVQFKQVSYRDIEDAKNNPPTVGDLPFLKRWPYEPEKEMRMLFLSSTDELNEFRLPIPLASIRTVYLSPQTKDCYVESRRSQIKQLGGQNIAVWRTTILDNTDWKSIASKIDSDKS